MIGFCKIKEKGLKNFCPTQKVGTGAPIPTIIFLLHYDNIIKQPAKF